MPGEVQEREQDPAQQVQPVRGFKGALLNRLNLLHPLNPLNNDEAGLKSCSTFVLAWRRASALRTSIGAPSSVGAPGSQVHY